MTLALIVAVSENKVIGSGGELPWRLSADLKRFKELTLGHSLIMGRKTYESIGRLLPGRKTVIVTRQQDYHVDGASIVNSVPEALELINDDHRPFVIGGGEVYDLFLPFVNEIYLTRVHVELAGDTFFPEPDWNQWRQIECKRYPRDSKNNFDYSFEVYIRSDADSPDDRKG
jgi:dihydrofolate reductase